ncbi:hypothetical protein [Streptomyces avermitilis]|uniref:hypothetical protein n=1 Tax=Streptomyces avermitilis TaxID=33903 RepID=UPI0038282535
MGVAVGASELQSDASGAVALGRADGPAGDAASAVEVAPLVVEGDADVVADLPGADRGGRVVDDPDLGDFAEDLAGDAFGAGAGGEEVVGILGRGFEGLFQSQATVADRVESAAVAFARVASSPPEPTRARSKNDQ